MKFIFVIKLKEHERNYKRIIGNFFNIAPISLIWCYNLARKFFLKKIFFWSSLIHKIVNDPIALSYGTSGSITFFFDHQVGKKVLFQIR